MALQRRKRGEDGEPEPVRVLIDPAFQKDHPTVWEHLTARAFEDGSPRVTSTITLFGDDGTLKCVLRDRDAEECLWVAAQTIKTLFLALEAALRSDTADWRRERHNGQQTAKRLKKS